MKKKKEEVKPKYRSCRQTGTIFFDKTSKQIKVKIGKQIFSLEDENPSDKIDMMYR